MNNRLLVDATHHNTSAQRRTRILLACARNLYVDAFLKYFGVLAHHVAKMTSVCPYVGLTSMDCDHIAQQEAFEKCWAHSPLRAVLHCHSPGVATVARRLRIDVHDNDDDNNDNA